MAKCFILATCVANVIPPFHFRDTIGYAHGMNLSEPASVLLSTGDAAVLSVLTRTTRPLSGREVAALSEANVSTAWRSLQRLADHGLLHVQEAGAGAALLYTLNREHLAVEAAQMLVTLRHRLIERLSVLIQGWTVLPRHASMFGSAVRGDGDTRSDIDILLIRQEKIRDEELWNTQINLLSQLVRGWTGNHAGISELTTVELERLVEERSPIIDELLRDAITLHGGSIRELIAVVTT